MIATYAASFRFFRVPGEGEVASQPWLLRPSAGIWLFQLALTYQRFLQQTVAGTRPRWAFTCVGELQAMTLFAAA